MYGYGPMETLAAAPVPLRVLVAGAGTADDDAARDRALALDEVLAAAGPPGCRQAVVRFPGHGHNLMRYRPDEVARGLLALAASRALGCERVRDILIVLIIILIVVLCCADPRCSRSSARRWDDRQGHPGGVREEGRRDDSPPAHSRPGGPATARP